MKLDKQTLKQETKYLAEKEEINKFLQSFDWQSIFRVMLDKLDRIDNLSHSQNMEMFRLISSLEDASQSYPRLFSRSNKLESC